MEHELPGILDGADEPATVEELEDVVRRAGQRRRATLVAGAAALLAVGALGGALARGSAEDGSVGFATEGQDTAAPSSSGSAAMAMPPASFNAGGKLTPLFRRDANGVAIRAYSVETGAPPPSPDPACGFPSHLVQVELSNSAAVGMGFASPYFTRPDPPSDQALRVSGTGSFGAAEGEPAIWAIVEVKEPVGSVRLKAGDATDSMVPEDGKAVLVVPGTPDGGVVEALAADGAVLASQPLSQPVDLGPPPPCAPPPCLAPAPALPPPPPGASQEPAAVPEPARPMDQPCVGHACASDSSAPPTTYPDGVQPPATVLHDPVRPSTGQVEPHVCAPPPSRPFPTSTTATGPVPPQVQSAPVTSAVTPAMAPAVTPAPTAPPVATGPGPTGPSQTSTTARNAAP